MNGPALRQAIFADLAPRCSIEWLPAIHVAELWYAIRLPHVAAPIAPGLVAKRRLKGADSDEVARVYRDNEDGLLDVGLVARFATRRTR